MFVYIGELDGTIAGCAAALRPGGLLLFSVETSTTADVVLQPSLRYAHAHAYVTALAAAHHLAIERAEPTVLRLDNQQAVHGTLYALRR